MKYTNNWTPDQGVAFKYARRGDEHRYFLTNDGLEGKLRVYELSDRWKWSVQIEGYVIANCRGFGESRKNRAKQICINELKHFEKNQLSKSGEK